MKNKPAIFSFLATLMAIIFFFYWDHDLAYIGIYVSAFLGGTITALLSFQPVGEMGEVEGGKE